jgi:hypothetical protein
MVSGNEMLGRNEVTRVWRKIHNGKLHKLYSSPNIVKEIKSKRVG